MQPRSHEEHQHETHETTKYTKNTKQNSHRHRKNTRALGGVRRTPRRGGAAGLGAMREPNSASGRLAHRPDPAAVIGLQGRPTRRTLFALCFAPAGRSSPALVERRLELRQRFRQVDGHQRRDGFYFNDDEIFDNQVHAM